jgi:MurNAc alpha-1-phosphate uridylyltransferase
VTHAVVMAAGEGSRLRPISERWPKPVLPIDGRPVIATLLHELASAGCTSVVVVTGHLAEQVEELVGDGSGFRLDVAYARQPAVLGSADTVRRALAAGAEPPLLVAAADTVFSPGDLRRFAAAHASSGAAGALAVRRDPPPEAPHRPPVRVVDGLVTKVIDDDPANPLGVPLCGSSGRSSCRSSTGSPAHPTSSQTRSSAPSARASRLPPSRSGRPAI